MKTTDNLNVILESKQFVKGGVTFPSPSELINPILDTMGDNFNVFGTHPVTIGENDEEISAFGRVGVVKTLYADDEMNYQIGFIYSLEQGKPFVKVFSGFNVKVCSNMCIFNTKDIRKYDILTSGIQGAYQTVKDFLKTSEEDYLEGVKIIKEMKSTQFEREEVKNFLGNMLLNFSATKNIAGTSCILNASKLLTDKNSIYYFDNLTTAWNVYQSLTDGYRDKTHIIDQPEKVLNIFNEMKNYKTFDRENNLLLS